MHSGQQMSIQVLIWMVTDPVSAAVGAFAAACLTVVVVALAQVSEK